MIHMMLVLLVVMLILLVLFASLVCWVFGTCGVLDVEYFVNHPVVRAVVVVLYVDDIVWYWFQC